MEPAHGTQRCCVALVLYACLPALAPSMKLLVTAWFPLPLLKAETYGSAGEQAPLVVPLAPRDITQHSLTLTDPLSEETIAS